MVKVDLLLSEIVQNLQVPSVKTILEPQAQLNEGFWLTDQLLEALSEIAVDTQKQVSSIFDDLLDEQDRGTNRLQLSEVVSSNLLKCLKNGILLLLTFLIKWLVHLHRFRSLILAINNLAFGLGGSLFRCLSFLLQSLILSFEGCFFFSSFLFAAGDRSHNLIKLGLFVGDFTVTHLNLLSVCSRQRSVRNLTKIWLIPVLRFFNILVSWLATLAEVARRMTLFLDGRRNTMILDIESTAHTSRSCIIHCSSFGASN